MKELLNKYLTIRNRNIIAIVVIILGIGFIVNYSFFEPTYINEYIAMKVYDAPANSYFDDDNFYKCVVDAYNTTNKTSLPYTTNLSDEELQSIISLSCRNKEVVSTKGLEKLISLTNLYVDDNQLNNLDLTNNTALSWLDVENNQLISLDVGKNKALRYLNIKDNQITNLDVSNNIGFEYLYVNNNQLTSLDVSKNTVLRYLSVDGNRLTSLDISKNTALEILTAYNNQLSNLDLTSNTALSWLDVENNQLTELELSRNTELTRIDLYSNKLTSLDVSNNKKLDELAVSGNQLTSLDVSNNIALRTLRVENNQLTILDVTNNKELLYLYAGNNKLTSLSIGDNTNLKKIDVYNNQLTNLDVSLNTSLTELSVSKNKLQNLNINGASSLTSLTSSYNQLANLDLSTNTALTKLEIDNNQLLNLDISNNIKLKYIYANDNQLTSVNMNGEKPLTELWMLVLYNNKLTNFDVSGAPALTTLYLYGNNLVNLNVSDAIKLEKLDVTENNLTILDVSKNTSLKNLDIYKNQLISLDVTNNNMLEYLRVATNKLTSIDVSGGATLKKLDIVSNPYGENIYVYKNNVVNVGDVVKIPEHLNWNSPTWTSVNASVATVDSEGMVIGINSGSVNIKGEVSGKYTINSTVNVVEITSDKYLIDESNNYISIGADNDIETIKKNINVSHENITIDVDLDNYKLYVKYEDEILKEFNIVGFYSDMYNLNNEYIYTGINEFNADEINLVNCTKEVEDNKLIIKYNDVLLDEYLLVSISSELYDLRKEYIYTGNDEINIDEVVVTNGSKVVEDNKLNIKYNDIILDEYLLVSISSEVYDLNKNHIYTGSKVFDSNQINIINGTSEVTDDKFIIKYNDNTLYEYPIIKIYSEVYEMTDEYIHTKNGRFSSKSILSNYELSFSVGAGSGYQYEVFKYNGEEVARFALIAYWSDTYNLENDYLYVGTSDMDLSLIEYKNSKLVSLFIEDNILKINYKEKTLREIDILSIGLDKLNVYDKKIIVLGDVNYNNFINNIDFNGVTYNVYNDDEEVTSGNVKAGMKLNIYYEEKLLDTYEFIGLDFGKYNIFGNNILLNESISYDDFVSNIETSDGVTYKIYNGEEEVTSGDILIGMKIKIYYDGDVIEEYSIVDEFLEFDSSLSVNKDNYIINDIKIGTDNGEILSKISTSGQVSVLDRDNNVIEDNNVVLGTGFKFKVDLSDYSLEYIVSVKGDITGDGIIDINDVIGISRHVVKGNYLQGIEYINAADIDNNDKVNINDVIKLAKKNY